MKDRRVARTFDGPGAEGVGDAGADGGWDFSNDADGGARLARTETAPRGPWVRAHAHLMINLGDAPCRYLCFSTLGFPESAVYPDSRKVGLVGGPASVDASGAPLVQVSRYGEGVGYYDGEEE